MPEFTDKKIFIVSLLRVIDAARGQYVSENCLSIGSFYFKNNDWITHNPHSYSFKEENCDELWRAEGSG